MSTPKRPLLRYHGGKWRLAPWVMEFFPEHHTYVEPYAGAASILMQKERVKCEVINDLDERLVNLFRVLQDENTAAELRRLCHLTPFARAEFDRSYEATDDPVLQAHHLIVRSFFGYGSKSCVSATKNGFRSRRADTNSPAVDWAGWPGYIPDFTERLRGVVLENDSALKVINRYNIEGSLMYVDPPYTHGTRNLNQGSYLYEMTDEDHRELAEALHQCKGYVVVSGYPSDLYEEIFQGWPQFSRKAHADMCSPRTEVVWISPRTSKVLERERIENCYPLLAGGCDG